MDDAPWQPVADMDMLRARAGLLASIRQFFADKGVLEVETPLLGGRTGTDPALDSIELPFSAGANGGRRMFLQTSPEFAMKRLLAAGSGPVFQICKAFRGGEAGRRHNPEFTMLEWYRVGFDHHRLMDEVEELTLRVLGGDGIRRTTYRELFGEFLDLDPHRADIGTLKETARRHAGPAFDSEDRDTWLELLYSHVIVPAQQQPVLVYDYPAGQAALARLGKTADGIEIAQRFELIAGGLEIANGYYELADADEQARRFRAEQAQRKRRGMPEYAVDERLLAALEAGLPDCAGVALGIDRLLMVATGADSIEDVLAFPFDRA